MADKIILWIIGLSISIVWGGGVGEHCDYSISYDYSTMGKM